MAQRAWTQLLPTPLPRAFWGLHRDRHTGSDSECCINWQPRQVVALHARCADLQPRVCHMTQLQHCISVMREDIDAYPSESLVRYHYSLLFPFTDDEPKQEPAEDEYLPLETILEEYRTSLAYHCRAGQAVGSFCTRALALAEYSTVQYRIAQYSTVQHSTVYCTSCLPGSTPHREIIEYFLVWVPRVPWGFPYM